jgi:gamma-glutamylcyclotransferase (GGCT)/AIG2-like uncharacterized protein YtfP
MISYYFAYGSNMDQQQMKERCPESKLLGKGIVLGYKLVFTIYSPKRKCGCADIVSSPKDEVWGLIYSVSENDLKRLDEYEKAPISYKRIQVEVMDESGNKVKAETYEVVNKSPEYLKPSRDYLSKLTTAAKTFSFPEKYQKMLNNFETKN